MIIRGPTCGDESLFDQATISEIITAERGYTVTAEKVGNL
jgi:hypothetical protein